MCLEHLQCPVQELSVNSRVNRADVVSTLMELEDVKRNGPDALMWEAMGH